MRTTRSLATLMLACLALLAPSATAHAQDATRFWIYYAAVDGEWQGSDQGVGSTVPEDGSIEGFRYGASADFPAHIAPRADLSEVTFEAVCGDVEPQDGSKRVAVVVDFGAELDAPAGAEVPQPYADCAQVAEKATGYQVLDSVADVRAEQTEFGPQVCGIDSYPASGPCFTTTQSVSPDDEGSVDVEIRSAAAEGDEAGSDEAAGDESDIPMLVGAGVVIALLAAGGVLLARRNRG